MIPLDVQTLPPDAQTRLTGVHSGPISIGANGISASAKEKPASIALEHRFALDVDGGQFLLTVLPQS